MGEAAAILSNHSWCGEERRRNNIKIEIIRSTRRYYCECAQGTCTERPSRSTILLQILLAMHSTFPCYNGLRDFEAEDNQWQNAIAFEAMVVMFVSLLVNVVARVLIGRSALIDDVRST